MEGKGIVKVEDITNRIYTLRGVHVMLDEDLARLYEVETRSLNQAVKRNKDRFPDEFMFQLTEEEYENLRSQFVTSSNEIYHIGASLKDLGKKLFAFSKMNKDGLKILERLNHE